MLDFHNHLIPGVDDGAATREESASALSAMRAQAVDGVIASPHVDGSVTLAPDLLADRMAELDAGWSAFQSVATEIGEVEVHRGAELKLDVPHPDLSDPRLRLAGTRFVLVEFAALMVPPRSVEALSWLRDAGWLPILAHPERYSGLERNIDLAGEWRRAGAYLQLNAPSLAGGYGGRARQIAIALLERGWADYLCSDYHARGKPSLADARAFFERHDGEQQFRQLTMTNPQRILEDRPPAPVPGMAFQPRRRPGAFQRLLGLFR